MVPYVENVSGLKSKVEFVILLSVNNELKELITGCFVNG
jgi:hypothetical protein